MEDVLFAACDDRNDSMVTNLLNSPWGIQYRIEVSGMMNTYTFPNTSFRVMHLACLTGNPTSVSLLFQCGANVNRTSEEEIAPLHMAALYGQCEVMTELLNLGADINAVDKSGFTPLHYAVLSDDPNTVSTLLTHESALKEGTPVDLNGVTRDGVTPLHIVDTWGNTGSIRELLNHGTPESIKEFQTLGMTALHYACYMGQEESVRLLFNSGADTTIADTRQRTPRVTALERGHMRIVDLLPNA